ncbi:G-type lectin S-receptor-like serine/threonine-protein kinase LECRK2 [Nicotiana tabacum]|uniref:Receptor-like serine/threonine-protein kinase n=2 Tax=Nicotiana TaxID=4085 RepID=A0A1S3Y8C2_TOBAC|nr:PREDICTED: G-type lectin S-receptor-like serine/threonine-protein kinase RLK1 [Nicotiana sylvestris]XP_016448249.1 PREDICTED: G-type lectin S-receptor-like serine/threonine-protein kinase RLK1 [Nicotiana tabacum]
MAKVSLLHHFLLICFLLLPNFAWSQTKNDVKIDSLLIAGDDKVSAWISPSGDFAFGFQQLGNEDQFLVSIWYNKISEKTIVWYANGDNPAPKGSRIELAADRGLVLTSPEQQEILISDPLIGTVAYGSMKDTGNFVLVNKNSESLWQSFNQSKDTILPSQEFVEGFKLSSRRSETNSSRGRFLLRMFQNGNIGIATVNLPSEHINENFYLLRSFDQLNATNYQLKFNESGQIFHLVNNSQEVVLSKGEIGSSTRFYHRATLNFDGVFTLYQHPKEPKGNGVWSAVWSIPDNICYSFPTERGSGVCGYNRICRLSIDKRPDCQCPRAFSLVDPEDDYKGCIPDFMQDCGDNQDNAGNQLEMETVTNIDWPTSDYELLQPFDEEKCKNACLNDCICAVSVFRENSCWKKKLPLSNGRVDNRVNSKAFIKRRKGNIAVEGPNSREPKKKNQDTIILIISVFLGSSVFVNCLLLGVLSLGFLLVYRNKTSTFDRNESSMDQNLRYFSYKELSKATEGFKEELGRGAFGIVYKGIVEIGKPIPIAVKKLDRIIQDGEEEFKTEVNVIGQTHHKNLVRLLGFCDEGPHRLLVYEFLNNGTLASFLFGDLKLTWNQRTQVALGIARGLLYLHNECSTQIIHCDIKPQNILLDNQYDPRISDFGLAKLLRMDQSETQTAIRGTKGYVAPEWFRNMAITVKADVYSFGVLLLEIICCRRNVDIEAGEDKAILTYWAYDCYQEGTIYQLVENDSDAISDRKKLERFLMVAIWCIQEDPSLRPTMKKIVLMLEEIVEVPSPPCPNPFRTENSLLDAV